MKSLTKFVVGGSFLLSLFGGFGSGSGVENFVTFGFFSSCLSANEIDDTGDIRNHDNELGEIHWQTDYNAALKLAEEEHKPLLVLFTGTDWCSWCTRLDKEVLQTPEFIEIVGKKFVFVKIDFPMKQVLPPETVKQNQALKEKFSIQGFPMIVLLTSKEQVIDKLGYSSGGGAKYAQKLLDSINKKLTEK